MLLKVYGVTFILMENLIKQAQFARQYNVSRMYINKLVKQNKLKVKFIGGTPHIRDIEFNHNVFKTKQS